jgi:hypothetical protein
MLIDSDEVWDDENWVKAMRYLNRDRGISAYRCYLKSYIKSPFYLIDDKRQGCKPHIFVRPDVEFKGVRGCGITPNEIMYDVFAHHFTAVKYKEEDVFKKCITSTLGDGATLVDMEKWKREVWANIPNVSNFHYNRGSEHIWKGIIKVGIEDLPKSIHNHPLVLGAING